MKNRRFIQFATLSIAIFCMGTQCNREYIEPTYTFVDKINLYPFQKSYKIGDTIWLQYSNPNKQLYDSRSKSYILADTVSIGFQVSFNSRYNAPVNPADGFCDFITVNGINIIRQPDYYGSGFFYKFGCNNNNTYDFTVGIVPKHKGIYSLDLLNVPRSVGACSNRISFFPLSTMAYSFNLADCNADIYLSIPAQSRGESPKGNTENEIGNKHIFMVKVD